MLLSLPAYLHDYPRGPSKFGDEGGVRSTRQSGNKIRSQTACISAVEFSSAALLRAVTAQKPALFKIPNFDAAATLEGLNAFAANDQHTFCTSQGAHGSDGLKMRVVFNQTDQKNMRRIEDGIYPEVALPSIYATEILNQACPPDSPLLRAWLDAKACIDSEFSRAQTSPETRSIVIATGNCSGVTGSHRNGGVLTDSNGAVVSCHYDDYAAFAVMAAGHKDFWLCSPKHLDVKPATNANINERHDIDPLFCEDGVWYLLKLRPGYMAYIPMHWWHQVCLRKRACITSSVVCVVCTCAFSDLASCCSPATTHSAYAVCSPRSPLALRCGPHLYTNAVCSPRTVLMLCAAHACPWRRVAAHTCILMLCAAHARPWRCVALRRTPVYYDVCAPLTALANALQVHTANQASFFCSWWFRPFDTEAPQLKRHQAALRRASDAEHIASSSASSDEAATGNANAPPVVQTTSLLHQYEAAFGTDGTGSDVNNGEEQHQLVPYSDSGEDTIDNGLDLDCLCITPSQSVSQIDDHGAPSQSFSHGAQPLSTGGLGLKKRSKLTAVARGPATVLTRQASPSAHIDVSEQWQPATEYLAFYPPLAETTFEIRDCKWANSGHRHKPLPATTALDAVPAEQRHKVCQVIKDKDVALRNATVTDVIVPQGQKIVRINCVAHAHMHVQKNAPGNLQHREALLCCLSWLKKIDEGNKVFCFNVVCGPRQDVVLQVEPTQILQLCVQPMTVMYMNCTAHTHLFCPPEPH